MIDLQYFPGWTRKAITFSIDDGNVSMDSRLIDIVKPYGIKGTFNLTSNFVTEHHTAEQIRRIYQGFEIADHVKYHPYAFADGAQPTAEQMAAEGFPGKEVADVRLVYPVDSELPGFWYRYCTEDKAWQKAATAQTYLAFADAGRQELEEIFGKGAVKGFAWPYCRQENTNLIEQLTGRYIYLRTAGLSFGREETSYDLPSDWNNWAINARHDNLVQRASQLETLPDTGVLKWMAFGVHSADFERDQAWEELERFCKRFGNRPEVFWYASNIEIYAYHQALRTVQVTGESIQNPSSLSLYIKIDGRPVILPPQSSVFISI